MDIALINDLIKTKFNIDDLNSVLHIYGITLDKRQDVLCSLYIDRDNYKYSIMDYCNNKPIVEPTSDIHNLVIKYLEFFNEKIDENKINKVCDAIKFFADIRTNRLESFIKSIMSNNISYFYNSVDACSLRKNIKHIKVTDHVYKVSELKSSLSIFDNGSAYKSHKIQSLLVCNASDEIQKVIIYDFTTGKELNLKVSNSKYIKVRIESELKLNRTLTIGISSLYGVLNTEMKDLIVRKAKALGI